MNQSNIKNFIRTGQFSKRSGRETNPTVLSTISSVGSVEDDGNATEIEDHPQATKDYIKASDAKTAEAAATDAPQGKPASRGLFGSMPSFVRRSTASRSSTIRSSTTSSVGLPTITETPPLPGTARDGKVAAVNANAPSTPPQAVAATALSPPSANGFSDTETIAASQSPPPRNPDTASPTASQPNSRSPMQNISQSTLHGWPLDSESEKKDYARSSVTFAPSMNGTSHRGSLPSHQSSDIPSSGFEWDLTRAQKAKGFITRWFVEWWLLEIISWVFSAICMAIILSVLLHYNGRPLPAWKLGLTLNSFISILSGFAKASLLLPTAEALGQLKWNWFSKKPRQMMDFEIIDSASRGPLGSMVLLANTKGVTLASVGAAIILLSLPLDLFFQQIVAYPTIWVKTGNASTPRATYYDPPPFYQHNAVPNDLNPNQRTLNADVIMTAAVNPYLWLNPYISQATPDVSCPTGRCTWKPFNTLAVCNKCVETPDLLEFGCKLAPNDWLNDTNTFPYSVNTTAGYTEVNSCGWYLTPPNHPPILMSGYSMGNSTTNSSFIPQALMGRTIPLRDIFTRKLLYDGPSINFPEIVNPIIDFIASGTPGYTQGALNNATPIVNECALYWCVNTITTTVIDSTVTEIVNNSVQVPSTFADNPWLDPASSWFQSEYGLVLPDGQSPGGYANFTVNNVTARATYQALEALIPSAWLQGFQVLPTQQAPDPNQVYLKYNQRTTSVISLLLSNSNATQWLPPGNVTELVTSMAHAMSVALRRTAQGFTTVIPQWAGDAWEQETRVHIRWPWIILPAALLIFSFLFLAVTIMRSEKDDRKIGIWKSSALAVLFNGLGDDVQDFVGTRTNLGHAREKAKQLHVQLDE